MQMPARPYEQSSHQLCWLPLNQIITNSQMSLEDSRSLSLGELAASIRRHGLLQPITVREAGNGRFEVVSGSRRYQACCLAGCSHIDAIVLSATGQGSGLNRILTNLRKQNLHFFEEAQAYETLLDSYGMTQDELARQLGCSGGAVANKLRLLRLELPLRTVIFEEGLSERHARAFLRLPSPEGRMSIAKKAAEQGLSVRDTELLIDSALQRLPVPPPPASGRVIALVRDHRLYMNALKGIVQQMKEAGMPASMEVTQFGAQIDVHITMPTRKCRREDEA